MLRVVGADPGTSSLDLVLLEDGVVADQVRLLPEQLRAAPDRIDRLLEQWSPLGLVAAPSGHGLPLVRGAELADDQLDQMALVRPEERGRDLGVIGFRSWARAFARAGAPVVFLPGGLHLPTVPAHRKAGAVDLGTADKIAVAALALWFDAQASGGPERSTFALVEIGSAFSAVLVVERGRIVDVAAGTRGPIGLRSGGCWDGELAYWRGPLSKADLFRGGLDDLGDVGAGAWRESLVKHVAGLRAVTPFDRIYVSGRGLERPDVARLAAEALAPFGGAAPLPSLAGAWAKHAAQGAALLADGLAGGQYAPIVAALQLRAASGSVWDALGGRPTKRPGPEP